MNMQHLIGLIEETFEGTEFAFEIVGQKAVSHLVTIRSPLKTAGGVLFHYGVSFDGINFECLCEHDVVRLISQRLRAKKREI